MKNFKWAISALVLTVATATFGASVTDNILNFGSGASDKRFIFNKGLGATNPSIRWNNSSSLLQFSHDGTTFRTFNLGTDITSGAATNGQVLTANGSGAATWANAAAAAPEPTLLENISTSAAVASSALTITLRDAGGGALSGTNFGRIALRAATASTGAYSLRSVTSALAITVPSGATLGHANAADEYVYVYAIDNAGTVELAVSGGGTVDEGSLVSTTAISAAADFKETLYSTTARTNVAIRLLGRMKTNQTTAGTWAVGPTEISHPPFNPRKDVSQLIVHTGAGHGTTNTKIRQISTVQESTSDVTYANTAAAGTSFTINRAGTYAVTYSDGGVGGSYQFGLSLNSAELTANIEGLTVEASKLALGSNAANWQTISTIRHFNVGDVIRPHSGGSLPASTSSNVRVVITRIN